MIAVLTICKRSVSVDLVEQAMTKIKFGKTDGNNGFSSNHQKTEWHQKTECIFFHYYL